MKNMFAVQRLDWDYWCISIAPGVLLKPIYNEIMTREYIEDIKGFKIGKKLKNQPYSDYTFFELLTPSKEDK